MIKIEHLQVRDYLKLDQLEIERGKIIAVCGPNGAGKSTLLEVLAGFLPIQKGQVVLSGRQLTDYSVSELAGLRSWLAQQPVHRAYLSVIDQLQLVAKQFLDGRRFIGLRAQVVEDVLQKLQLRKLANRQLWQLSGGELQRVYLSCLLICSDNRVNPHHQLMLLDEPMNALDPKYQHVVMDVLMTLQKQGKTILLSLHDLNIATFYSMDVLLLDQGRLTIYGEAQQVLTESRLAELFGVSMTQIRINGHTQLILS